MKGKKNKIELQGFISIGRKWFSLLPFLFFFSVLWFDKIWSLICQFKAILIQENYITYYICNMIFLISQGVSEQMWPIYMVIIYGPDNKHKNVLDFL